MIKPFTKALTLILIAGAMLTACKKDKEDILTVTQENLAGTYTLGSVMAMGKNVTNEMLDEACMRDDEFVLLADNTFKYVDAGTKCDDDGSYIDDWYLDNNVLYIDGLEGTIKKLSNKVLVIEEEDDFGTGPVTVTYTFNRK